MLSCYRRKNPDWRLLYRERSAGGVWGPVETISVPWSERPDIIEDPLGRPHVFYAGTGAGGKTDLFQAIRSGGVWTVTQFTNTDTIDEDYVRLATDSLGRMHLVYARNTDIYYRVWNGSWSGETYLGHCETTYYHRPDLSVDSANCLHVTWEDSTHFYYRKFSGTAWLPQVTIGTGSDFFSYGKVAALSSSSVVAVTFDQLTTAVLKWTHSTDGGSTWAPLQYLNDGHYPSMDAWAGNAYLVYEWVGAKSIGYRKWNGSSWTAAEHASLDSAWQGWPDVAVDTSGVVHCVYDDNSQRIGYSNSAPDIIAPQPITALSAAGSDASVQLHWTNPSDIDLQGALVRCKTGGYPTGPTDGTLVCNLAVSPGSASTYTHAPVTNGLNYYYCAYAYDLASNHAGPAQAIAQPHAVKCLEARQLAENAWVSLAGKIVTANFVTSDGCIYVQEPDRTSGIRVQTVDSSLSAGDLVNLSGAVSTRVLSGHPSERYLSGATVTRLSAGPTPSPLAITCRSVGGGSLGSLVPGVRNGVGLNNVGLLVRISGKVTFVAGTYLYVDGGSMIENLYGLWTQKVGVMIKCPSAPSVVEGNNVIVTGIVEGSVPNNADWSTNRAYIHIRDLSDLRVLP